MSDPLITIILTVFNNEASIIETIKSIINQTYKNIEILIMDNASTDNTIPLLKNYRKKYPNIRVLSEDTVETIEAQKIALIRAKGKYITFAESGKLMSPYYIEYMVSNLESKQAEIISCDFFTEDLTTIFHNKDIIKKSPPEKIEKITNVQYLKNLYSKSEHTYKSSLILWNKLINKQWLISTHYIQKNFSLNTSYEIINEGCTILTTNQYLICDVQYDRYYEENCFKYEHLDTIKFLETLLIKYKNEKNETAMYNTSIRLLKFLLKVRKQLSFYALDIYDKLELQKSTDLKFNSIYKYLKTKHPAKHLEYDQYHTEYRKLLILEKSHNKKFE